MIAGSVMGTELPEQKDISLLPVPLLDVLMAVSSLPIVFLPVILSRIIHNLLLTIAWHATQEQLFTTG
jgi:hypothetical protein